MNKVLLQFWEESERKNGVKPDGASLHIDMESYKKYLGNIYGNRVIQDIPDEYDRIVGTSIETIVSDDIYNLVLSEKNIRLSQYQLNNLIKLKNIIVD